MDWIPNSREHSQRHLTWQKITPHCSDHFHPHFLHTTLFFLAAGFLWTRPRGLTFTWWGCYVLCFWHKPTELAHSFLFCSCVYFCLNCPFNCISFHKFSRQLSAFSLSSCGLISALLVLSTLYLFMKVSLSPDIILCGWLGLKHQLTNQPTYEHRSEMSASTGDVAVLRGRTTKRHPPNVRVQNSWFRTPCLGTTESDHPNIRLVGEMPYSKFDLKKKIIKTTQQNLSWLTRWTVRPVTQVWLPDETGWRIVSPFFWVTRLCCVVHECMFRPCVFSTHWDRCAR